MDRNFQQDKDTGEGYQDFIAFHFRKKKALVLSNYSSKKAQLEHGENPQGFEIKFDSWCTKSKRLSIEIAAKSKDATEWKPSGLYHPTVDWIYVQGNRERCWVMCTKQLRKYHEDEKPREHEECGTVRAFYLPIEIADQYDLNLKGYLF